MSELDRQHLLGEHAELHVIWSVIVNDKKGYSRHPETLRFKNHPYGLSALYHRHLAQAEEMRKRGYNHKSPLQLNDKVESWLSYVYSEEEYRRDHEELMRRQNKEVKQ